MAKHSQQIIIKINLTLHTLQYADRLHQPSVLKGQANLKRQPTPAPLHTKTCYLKSPNKWAEKLRSSHTMHGERWQDQKLKTFRIAPPSKGHNDLADIGLLFCFRLITHTQTSTALKRCSENFITAERGKKQTGKKWLYYYMHIVKYLDSDFAKWWQHDGGMLILKGRSILSSCLMCYAHIQVKCNFWQYANMANNFSPPNLQKKVTAI